MEPKGRGPALSLPRRTPTPVGGIPWGRVTVVRKRRKMGGGRYKRLKVE